MLKSRYFSTGFTLMELIVTLIVVGIISAYAASRFFDTTAFTSFGFFEESLSAVRYAQKLAIASGCDIRVTFSGGGYSLHRWVDAPNDSCRFDSPGANLTDVTRPGGGVFSSQGPDGVNVGSAQFVYDPVGVPRTTGGGLIGGETTIVIGGRTLSVAPHTGFARCTAGC
ncbi:MAG: GspH/FimT family pseudopilin [Gammaproteobacteria bacterium]